MKEVAEETMFLVGNNQNSEITTGKKIGFISLAGLLGIGRMISNIALINQGMQKTFFLIGLKKSPYPETLSFLAALSNMASDGLTRLPSIYDSLVKPKGINDHSKELECYTFKLKGVYYCIVTAGYMDMGYTTLNNLSAVIQLQCQYLGDEHCKNGFDWRQIYVYASIAAVCALSTGITFAAFNLPSIKKNAFDFVCYLNTFSDNFALENKWLLAGTSIFATLYSFSLGATLFFSTSKMTFNFFGPTLSANKFIQAQIYISMVTSIIGALFSWVAEGKKLLQGQKAGFREWFFENTNVSRGVCAASLFPILGINVASHALNNFPGNVEILDKIFSGYEKFKMGFALVNSLNTAFLHFAFNTGRAISYAADVPNEVKASESQSNNTLIQQPSAKLLAFHGIFNACSPLSIDDDPILINESEPLESNKGKRCGCTLL